MLPFHLVYHEAYDLNLGSHVFPSQKFRMIHDRLLAEGVPATAGGLIAERSGQTGEQPDPQFDVLLADGG